MPSPLEAGVRVREVATGELYRVLLTCVHPWGTVVSAYIEPEGSTTASRWVNATRLEVCNDGME